MKKWFDRAPGIFVNALTGKIKVYVSVQNKDGTEVKLDSPGLPAETLGFVQSNKWTFVAVTVDKKTIRIHINGILDAIQNFDNYKIKPDTNNIFIGGVPILNSKNKSKIIKNLAEEVKLLGNCNITYNIDSLKIFNLPLKLYQIQAFVKGSLGMIEPGYIHLSCQDCTLAEAKAKCINGYHLCNSLEFYSGVYQAIKVMGWSNMNYNIFAADSTHIQDPNMKGLGVCCRDGNI